MILCGVVAADDRGLDATSDGDVALHAVADALLGAAALGDLGMHFPSTAPVWVGASSADILRRVVSLVRGSGYSPGNVDVTIVAQSVPIAPHREAMRAVLAGHLGIAHDFVSVKATTTDGMGFTGRDEGIAVFAAATVQPLS